MNLVLKYTAKVMIRDMQTACTRKQHDDARVLRMSSIFQYR